MIKRDERRADYADEQRKGIIEAIKGSVAMGRKPEIMEMVKMTWKREHSAVMKGNRTKERLYEGLKEVGSKSRKRGSKKLIVEGDKRISMIGDEGMLLLPQEVVKEHTWRKEKKRCKLVARWESPMPGTPGVDRIKMRMKYHNK